MDRRTFIKASAWSVPVIMVASAVPLASASVIPTKFPISCVYLQNNGHGGNPANAWWHVTYNDGSYEDLDNGTVMSNKELKALCGKKEHS